MANLEKIDGCHHVVCPCGRDFNYDRKKAALFYAAKTAIAFGGAVLIILAIVFAPVLVVIHYSWTDRPLKILKNCVGFIMDLLGFD